MTKSLKIGIILLLVSIILTSFLLLRSLDAKYAETDGGKSNSKIGTFSVSISNEKLTPTTFDPYKTDKINYTCNIKNNSEVAIDCIPNVKVLDEYFSYSKTPISLAPKETKSYALELTSKGYDSVDKIVLDTVQFNFIAEQRGE